MEKNFWRTRFFLITVVNSSICRYNINFYVCDESVLTVAECILVQASIHALCTHVGFPCVHNCMMQSLTVTTWKLHLLGSTELWWSCGIMVARLTPDQKIACSNHVGIIIFFTQINLMQINEYLYLFGPIVDP